MDFNFVWMSPTSGAPIISIALYGITFNSSAIELLNKSDRIMIGFDQDKNLVGIKSVTEDDNENINKSFPFMEREKNGYIRINNKDFVKYLANKTGIDFSKAVKYIPDWNEDEKLLIINLNKPIDGFDNNEENETIIEQ